MLESKGSEYFGCQSCLPYALLRFDASSRPRGPRITDSCVKLHPWDTPGSPFMDLKCAAKKFSAGSRDKPLSPSPLLAYISQLNLIFRILLRYISLFQHHPSFCQFLGALLAGKATYRNTGWLKAFHQSTFIHQVWVAFYLRT